MKMGTSPMLAAQHRLVGTTPPGRPHFIHRNCLPNIGSFSSHYYRQVPIVGTKRKRKMNRWTKEETALLREMIKSGLSKKVDLSLHFGDRWVLHWQ